MESRPANLVNGFRPAHRFSFNEVNLETACDPPDIGLSDDVTRMTYNKKKKWTPTLLAAEEKKRKEMDTHTTGRR
ncbi:MAG: hypothetical protein PF630_07835 [Gammaproteobacteria bacterium]|jgi:hypothetical protein|nr:hypothetical protein [Gammaproteobacteria bacterium]